MSVLLGQFLELGVVLVAAVEEVVPFLLRCQELFLLLLLGNGLLDNGLKQVLFESVVDEDVQLLLKGLVLQLRHVDLHDAFQHFRHDFPGVGHHLGQRPREDVELHQKLVLLRFLLLELLDLERVVLDRREGLLIS